MAVRRAGNPEATYLNTIQYELRCICEMRGDKNTFVDGMGPYCVIFDREYDKIQIDDVGVDSTTIEAVWLTDDQILVKKGSIFMSGGHTYKAKNSPVDKYDGWTSVQLQKTCDC